jgi:1-acyl-sn-glycerol-3-phosphate acyltransferase
MPWPTLDPAVPRRRNPLTRWLGRTVFALLGWRLEGSWPDSPKLIVAVAPHTSNMDFILSVAVFWGLELKTHFLAKDSLFWFPLGSLIRFLGGIPVDRSAPQGMVESLRARFAADPQLVVGITPEGTRSRVREWKSGFARISAAAGVPVLPAIVNYERKIVYLTPPISGLESADEILAATQRAASIGSPRNP